MTGAGDAVARLVRDEGTRVLATLVRVTGSVDLAEDAVQDAVVRALETWPRDGVPGNPRGWLLVAARRRAVDVVRREAKRQGKEAVAMPDVDPCPDPVVVRDDLLRLVFTCCHPALSLDAQVALALRTLGGLSTAEVARGLLVPEATMAKRLTRAKQKIAQARIPYRVPAAEELPARLAGVASTVYLIFNEGYTGRVSLLDEGVRLARLLVSLMPDEPTALGLLALVLLQDARRPARFASGVPVLLSAQDRSSWDASLIKEGVELVGRGLRRTPSVPNAYVVQAAVAACHDLAPSYEDTNWDAVISWYDVLLSVQDTPVVRLNRAAAVAERDGPSSALALVDALPGLDDYPWWHASRAELLHRLGSRAAVEALARAVETGLPAAHVAHLQHRLGQR
ncbi:RNA polymerase ECF-subfamily sigma factor [Amycolatopsis mediterranei S699]|uniref:RNA polymerase ECF-subfamily sigma factor n=2 Tax=Amycolatopsis mediterranei TaxID=33910 RepID=A0A0H3DKX4_AMYMU|nr:sigma-70 family RNA polymerase sigma factor [Amycolatopsis mediterranei]ADJ50872.1 RNA polymerase ECF-subfamily sigma factor [Amycolatopsis mediterranei U32]AEK47884.1 RNA polymerase ECF-subfamily sigma factor [Amycolatopsis mediterranei S699]AFO82578.1 RNA polymerase ECF-subfamily sigma factor [Amycolatopsis mediterranei S699]AGT89707.1 RNA polymerase ECF-subfamily sigma factor [Amycolatopsis mediterranei RB]KDO12134.1 RNA polymerase subunit sigma-24 [Amycolatopsis mediterranei]